MLFLALPAHVCVRVVEVGSFGCGGVVHVVLLRILVVGHFVACQALVIGPFIDTMSLVGLLRTMASSNIIVTTVTVETEGDAQFFSVRSFPVIGIVFV